MIHFACCFHLWYKFLSKSTNSATQWRVFLSASWPRHFVNPGYFLFLPWINLQQTSKTKLKKKAIPFCSLTLCQDISGEGQRQIHSILELRHSQSKVKWGIHDIATFFHENEFANNHHHHHQVALTARISLILSLSPSLSFSFSLSLSLSLSLSPSVPIIHRSR